MTRRWHLALSLVVLVLTTTVAASAEPLRTALVGDRMDSLLAGLTKVELGPIGSCAASAPVISYVDYVVPGRSMDDDNASLVGLAIGDRIVVMVVYDEQDLSTPVDVYADLDGNGLITNVWPFAEAPAPCEIMQRVRYHP
jgi:hypothetical protein